MDRSVRRPRATDHRHGRPPLGCVGPLGTSLVLTAIYVGLWMSIEGVIVPMLSYLPVLAPFWFIPDEAVSHRFLVGQGTRLLGEAIGAAVYVLLWIWALGHTLLPKAGETSGS